MHWTAENQKYMKLALELARRGEGRTNPNPMVGAVLVKHGTVIGQGWHQKFGGPHAEIEALCQVADHEARGAELYVTLEPCAHHGKTPPCTEALIAKGIAKVYVAMEDPNPLVAGKGIKALHDHGISVDVGLMAKESADLNEIFLHHIQHKSPFVAVKTAMTLDGKIATTAGMSKWITGPESRAQVHQLRNRYGAILVGAGTVVADNPSLTARLQSCEETSGERQETIEGQHPLRVILDSGFRSSLASQVFNCTLSGENAIRTLLFTTAKAPPEKLEAALAMGVDVHICQRGRIEPAEVLKVLSHRNIDSLLIEGGSAVNASFFEADAVHKVYAFLAPKLIGGAGKTPLGGTGKENLSDAWELENIQITSMGKDILIEGRVRKGVQSCLQD